MNAALITLYQRYGPWAVIAGASEGTGSAYARLLAEQGFSLILIARRQEPLGRLAQDLRTAFRIECITASIDLGQTDAIDRVTESVAQREVGLYISNAGADPHGARFVDQNAAASRVLLVRNVLTTMLCSHHFAERMRDRGSGGLLFSNSFACYGGGQFMACYAGSKAFDLIFAEALWAELKPHGVDVLSLVMGMTDTPAFNALLSTRGAQLPPGVASADAVAAFGLANLANGPVQNFGVPENYPLGDGIGSAAERRARVQMIDAASSTVFGT